MAIKGTYNISVGLKAKSKIFRMAVAVLNEAKLNIMSEPNYLHYKLRPKIDDSMITNQKLPKYPDSLSCALGLDREFPLESVELQCFNQKHDKNVESTIIHIGQSADYITRSMNVLAIATKGGIYFRNNKFNTTTEEGRKLLAHELTHMAQFKTSEFESENELELEAVQEEHIEVPDSNIIEIIEFSGKSYRLRKSEQKNIINRVADNIIKWLEEQKILCDDEEYLKLLETFRDYITDFDMAWNLKTNEQRQMENELKKELQIRVLL